MSQSIHPPSQGFLSLTLTRDGRHSDLNVGNFLCEIVINENTGQIEAKGVEQSDLGPPGVHWRKGEELDESKFVSP